MTDYGHDLRFGSFITPQNERPEHPAELARLSERAGLDLVTFQDHPYQPAFLENWTLLSIREHTSGLYINFETDRRPQRLHDAFPGETLAGLRRVKAVYDPQDVFNQVVPLAQAEEAGASGAGAAAATAVMEAGQPR
jgi:hypothetical protein